MLAALEGLNDTHCATAIGAWFFEGERLNDFSWGVFRNHGWFRTEQNSDCGNVGLSFGAGQQTVMTDAVETVGENVDQEPADELARCQAHNLLAITALGPVVLPLERNGIGIGADETTV